jgi:transposase InsO family protein
MIVDQFTKWLECFPIANQTAEVVSKVVVDNVFSRLGCPIELHTDQGENMDGNLVRQLCGLLQIAKTITTPYHPSSNGQVERYNRTILQLVVS